MQDRKSQSEMSTTRRIMNATTMGAGIMLLQAPFINAFNQWSVICCRYNLSDIQAFNTIFYGNVSGVQPSLFNFRMGMRGHLGKEFPRLFSKSTGLYVAMPWLHANFSPAVADVLFAGGLSCIEMLLNPFDYWRVTDQAQVGMRSAIRAFYAGALANGARQFGTWWGFSWSNRNFNTLLTTYTQIDPHSVLGIGVKVYPQAFFFTSLVYWLERIKNEIQFKKETHVKTQGSQYWGTAKHIWNTQGFKGLFCRGFHPKVMSNTVAAVGAHIILELGLRASKRTS